ncbi:MAG: M56 family metallopeptidase [Pirellulaceae bacterium]
MQGELLADRFLVEGGPVWELLWVLGMGTALVVAIAALWDRCTASAIWRRTIWRVATSSLLLLLVCELTGLGSGVVQLARGRSTVDATATRAAASGSVRVGVASAELNGSWSKFSELPPDEAEMAGCAPSFAPGDETLTGLDPEEQTWLDVPSSAGAGLEDVGQTAARIDILVPEEGTRPAALRGFSVESDRSALGFWWPRGEHLVWIWVVWIWALGTLAVLLRVVGSRLVLSVCCRWRAVVREKRWIVRIGALSRRLGMRRSVRLLEFDRLATPVTFGIFRPTIVLPVTFAEDFDDRQQDVVLAHELAHLAARDPLWHLLADLLAAGLWWHPLVWWSRRQLRASSEWAADEASLVVPEGPAVLADCLVTLGHRLSHTPRLEWLSIEGTGFRSSLGRRVERLLSLPSKTWSAPRGPQLVLAGSGLPVTFVLLVALFTAWVRPQVVSAEGETDVNLLNASWRRSLAAMALVGWLSSPGEIPAQEPTGDEPTSVAAVENPPPQADPQHQELPAQQEAEHNDRGEDFLRAQKKLHKELQRIEDELRQVPEQEGERREQLHRKLEQVRRQLQDGHNRASDRPHSAVPPPFWAEWRERAAELLGRRHELEEQGHAIRRELGEMLDDPDSERAQDMRARLEKVKREAEEAKRAVAEMAKAQMREVEEQARRLRDSGQHEAAQKILGQWMEEFKQLSKWAYPESKQDPKPLEQRIEHLKVAIDNLRAAGFHEPAEQFQKDLERMIREHREAYHQPGRDGPPQAPPHVVPGPPHTLPNTVAGPPQAPPHMVPPPQGDLKAVIEQMRAEQRQLRDEMHELREMFKKQIEREQPR